MKINLILYNDKVYFLMLVKFARKCHLKLHFIINIIKYIFAMKLLLYKNVTNRCIQISITELDYIHILIYFYVYLPEQSCV